MITLEKTFFLWDVDLFRRMPSHDLSQIARISEEVVYSFGETIFAEGDYGDCLFVIVEGQVSITFRGETIATLKERNYFGEMSLLDDEPRSATARAESDCLLLRIRRQEFRQTLARHFEAALAVIATLSQRIRSQLERGSESGKDDLPSQNEILGDRGGDEGTR